MYDNKLDQMLDKFKHESAERQGTLKKRNEKFNKTITNKEKVSNIEKLEQIKREIIKEDNKKMNENKTNIVPVATVQEEVKKEDKPVEIQYISSKQIQDIEEQVYAGISKYFNMQYANIIKRFNYVEGVLEPYDKKSTITMITILENKGYEVKKKYEFEDVFDANGNKIGRINKTTGEYLKENM